MPQQFNGNRTDGSKGSVLIIIGTLDGGGAENHIAQIAPRLQKRGWQVSVFCLKKRGPLVERLESQGIQVFGSRISRRVGGLSNLKDLCWIALDLFLFLKKSSPDITHFFLPHAYLLGGIISIFTGSGIRVMSRRSLNDYQNRHHKLLAWFEKKLHQTMSGILGNSRAVAQQLRCLEDVPESKLAVIYNGIEFITPETKELDRVRRELTLAPDSFIMIIVANLIPYKGHMDLFQALGQIRDKLPEDWQLLIVGEDRGIQAKLERLAGRLEIGNHVRFLGWRPDSHILYSLSDLGLLCSHEEGFSNAILEGMSAGLPFIATDVGGNGEAIKNRETGLIVPPKSPETLAKAILEMAQSKAFAQQCGRAALERVRTEFSQEKCVSQYDSFYSGLLAGQPAGEILAPEDPQSH